MLTRICKASAFVFTILALAACGGGGGGGGSGNITPDGPGGPSKVFLADSMKSVVFSAVNVNPPTGVLTVSRTISGTGVSTSMPDMAYDTANDLLFVVNVPSTSIAVFEHASTANGNIAPARTISSTAIAGAITSIYLDTAHNELYVTDAVGILVFSNARAASGSVTPSHTITIKRGASPIVPDDVFVDTIHNVLYAKSPVSGVVGVAQSISIFGTPLPDGENLVNQELTFTIGANIRGIVGDAASNMLYVVNSTASTVMVFNGASAAHDPVTPDRTINTPTFLQRIELVPSTNRLYGIAADQKSVYIVNNASTANSVVTTVPVTTVTNSSFDTLTGLAVAQ